jgi:hypothetical protein
MTLFRNLSIRRQRLFWIFMDGGPDEGGSSKLGMFHKQGVVNEVRLHVEFRHRLFDLRKNLLIGFRTI